MYDYDLKQLKTVFKMGESIMEATQKTPLFGMWSFTYMQSCTFGMNCILHEMHFHGDNWSSVFFSSAFPSHMHGLV